MDEDVDKYLKLYSVNINFKCSRINIHVFLAVLGADKNAQFQVMSHLNDSDFCGSIFVM